MLPPTDERARPWFHLMTCPASAFAEWWERALACSPEPGLVGVHAPAANWVSQRPWTPDAILATVLLSQRNLSTAARAKGMERMLEWHLREESAREPLRSGVSARCLVIWALATANTSSKVYSVRRLGLDAFDALAVQHTKGDPTLRVTHPDVVALPDSLAPGYDRWPNRSQMTSRVRPLLEAALARPGQTIESHEREAWQRWLQMDLVPGLRQLDYHWVHGLVEQEPDLIRRQATAVRLVDRLQKTAWKHVRSRDDEKVARWQAEAMARLGDLFAPFRAYDRAQQAMKHTTERSSSRRMRP